jgi:hypothetical protein
MSIENDVCTLLDFDDNHNFTERLEELALIICEMFGGNSV